MSNPLPPEVRFIPYEHGDRPLCDFCPAAWHKRAVWLDTLRNRPLCARCTVARAEQSAEERREHERRRLTREQRRLRAFGVGR